MLYKDQKLDSFQYKWVNGSIFWACGPKLWGLDPLYVWSVLFRLPEETVASKTSEVLELWFVVSVALVRKEKSSHFVFTLENSLLGGFPAQSEWNSNFDLLNEFAVHFALARHRRLWDKLFKLMNWLLHSSSRLLCGQSLDVHCRLERINRKSNFWNNHNRILWLPASIDVILKRSRSSGSYFLLFAIWVLPASLQWVVV